MTPTPSWRDRAACRGRTSLFYPPTFRTERPAETLRREARAVALCNGCPVRAECKQWLDADHHQEDAVAAGFTPGDRDYRRAVARPLFDDRPYVHEPVVVNFKTPNYQRYPRPRLLDPRELVIREHLVENHRLANQSLGSLLDADAVAIIAARADQQSAS